MNIKLKNCTLSFKKTSYNTEIIDTSIESSTSVSQLRRLGDLEYPIPTGTNNVKVKLEFDSTDVTRVILSTSNTSNRIFNESTTITDVMERTIDTTTFDIDSLILVLLTPSGSSTKNVKITIVSPIAES